MSEMMKLSDLPAGSKQLARFGKALTGAELADGLVRLVAREAGAEPASYLIEVLANEAWTGEHLTWPRAAIEWAVPEPGSFWLIVYLSITKRFAWSYGPYVGEIMSTRIGPCDRPDDLREALGLPVVAKFKTAAGAVVSVRVDEVVEAMAQYKPQGVRQAVKEAEAAVVEHVVNTPVEVAMAELVAEPPAAPQMVTKPQAAPVASKPSGVVIKGGKR